MKNIYMNNIIGEAIIFTMGYALVNIEDSKEKSSIFSKDDIPEFKDILMDNIICNSAGIALKINGLKELPIHDVTLKNSKLVADKGLELKDCVNINFENVNIEDSSENKYFEFLKIA